MAITYKEEVNLNDLNFKDVIDGLNNYFAEDETRVRVPGSYVEIKNSDKIIYRFVAEKHLDKLIAWLRTEHGIFYYPGMEAKYAKTEKIPPLTERLMDKGALNSLKKLYKRVVGEEPIWDSHTLIAEGIAEQVSIHKIQIDSLQKDLKKEKEKALIEAADREEEIESLQKRNYELYLKYRHYIMKKIRFEASLNGFELPEKVDGAPLSIERVFRDLIELLKKRDAEIKNLNAELATKWTKTSLINWLQQRARHKNVELDDTFLYSDDAQYDWTDIVDFLFDEIVKMRVEIKAKESGIEDLKEHITLLEADLKKTKQKEAAVCKDIMHYIRQEASRNGFDLPEEIDGEPLTVKMVFRDLLELMRKRGEELRILKSKCDRLNEIVEELNALNNEIKE